MSADSQTVISQLEFHGHLIAESSKAHVLHLPKADQPLVFYPISDVRTEYLEESDHVQFHPHLGFEWWLNIRVRCLIDVTNSSPLIDHFNRSTAVLRALQLVCIDHRPQPLQQSRTASLSNPM
jgi:hypothetical protein